MTSHIANLRRTALGATALFVLMSVAACSGGGKDKGAGPKAGTPGQGTPQVGYVVVQPSSVAMTTELSGRTTAFESSDVRPQVTGLIRRRFFTEGTLVTKGQPLYEIDPRLYRASANQARANVESAQANAEATQILAERYKPLAAMEAISKQDYTNAVSSARQARASVAQNKAALDTARINLKFTLVPAPISGRIGRSLFTVGALVSSTQTDPLAQIQRLDPMFVDIQQSAGDMLSLRRSLGHDGVVATEAQVHLKLDDGSDYPLTGAVEFAEALVDQTTGTVTLRARFANPQGILLPGMFVHATFAQAIDNGAFLVPQAGVSRDAKGNATVTIVGPGNKALLRDITADRTQGPNWVVTKGLKPGDKIIVQGLSKLKPGQGIKPVPANTPQKVEVPKGADTKSKKAG